MPIVACDNHRGFVEPTIIDTFVDLAVPQLYLNIRGLKSCFVLQNYFWGAFLMHHCFGLTAHKCAIIGNILPPLQSMVNKVPTGNWHLMNWLLPAQDSPSNTIKCSSFKHFPKGWKELIHKVVPNENPFERFQSSLDLTFDFLALTLLFLFAKNFLPKSNIGYVVPAVGACTQELLDSYIIR